MVYQTVNLGGGAQFSLEFYRTHILSQRLCNGMLRCQAVIRAWYIISPHFWKQKLSPDTSLHAYILGSVRPPRWINRLTEPGGPRDQVTGLVSPIVHPPSTVPPPGFWSKRAGAMREGGGMLYCIIKSKALTKLWSQFPIFNSGYFCEWSEKKIIVSIRRLRIRKEDKSDCCLVPRPFLGAFRFQKISELYFFSQPSDVHFKKPEFKNLKGKGKKHIYSDWLSTKACQHFWFFVFLPQICFSVFSLLADSNFCDFFEKFQKKIPNFGANYAWLSLLIMFLWWS